MEYPHILISPLATEKSVKGQEARKYTFLVHLKADKRAVQAAVEKAYGVEVQQVNILPVAKKFRTSGRGPITKRSQARKAIVTLAPNQSLDFNKIKVS